MSQIVFNSREELNAYIQGIIDTKLSGGKKQRFITRPEIMEEIGRSGYDNFLNYLRKSGAMPIKNRGRNSKVRVLRTQYEDFLQSLSA